jgi:hypothetical protein
MPWTFSHPAGALLFRRYCPEHLSLVALFVGSMVPDLGYYLSSSALGAFAHTFMGSLLFCLPAGLGLLAVLHILRKPLWFMLPQPHRDALEPWTRTLSPMRPSRFFTLLLSLALGTWTHTIWDSLTHSSGWAVANSTWLRQSVFSVGTADFPVYYLLQHLSTLCGAALLITMYSSWLARQRRSPRSSALTREEGWRYAFLVTIAVVALAIAVPLAARTEDSAQGYLALDFFVFHAAIYATVVFATIFVVCSILCYTARREKLT